MSYLARRAATLSIPRTALVTVPRASFTTTVLLRKTATETVKDGVKAVDRAVSDKLVDGINIGAAAGEKVKEAVQDTKGTDTAAKANELSGKASGKASELTGEAKGKAAELSGKAKGTAEEVKHKI